MDDMQRLETEISRLSRITQEHTTTAELHSMELARLRKDTDEHIHDCGARYEKMYKKFGELVSLISNNKTEYDKGINEEHNKNMRMWLRLSIGVIVVVLLPLIGSLVAVLWSMVK